VLFSYFLQLGIPYLIAFAADVEFFYKQEWIDPRNKAYGIGTEQSRQTALYKGKGLMALYKRKKVDADRQNMISILSTTGKKPG
jgi:hypothetical protein